MSENNIKRYSLDEIRAMKGQTNWERLRNAPDFEGPDDEDFEVDWSKAEIVPALSKIALSMRVDPDILDFFKSQGPGYQTRINAVLRSYMEARLKAG